ncbi:MAG TPA: peptidoglycan DD-metalloendopeptidase family protein [Longimicrobiaceae bacterium]|nr:peptidoglycan DD-metalloendopeptidase family protein [Longimicrobiaceae bacterium]
MSNSYRILALALFAVFGVSLVSQIALGGSSSGGYAEAPALLPAAYANPAEVSVQDTLHAGETLSELLERSRLAEADARALLAELQEHQDPRRLHPGAVISYRRSFVDGAVRGLDLSLDADRTLSIHREGSAWDGSVERVPVQADTAVLTGSVQSSLYAALLASDASGVPAAERERIADLLADKVFAWQIDFSRDLRKGDRFRILYERMVRPDGTARMGRVVAVQFSVNDRNYEAYSFTAPDGSQDYYDQNGESLRRAFLRAPLEFRRISSSFSTGRFHPILKKTRAHHGIDYAANMGTPIRAVGDGTVVRAGRAGGYGNLIEIRHIRGYSTRYAHMRGFAKGIRAGTRVKQGEIIGYVGSTGLSTGPHLHYEFRSRGTPINPNSIRDISGDPVPEKYRTAFRAARAEQVAALNGASGPVLLAAASDASGSGN